MGAAASKKRHLAAPWANSKHNPEEYLGMPEGAQPVDMSNPQRKEIKLLLLGAGESGKSTVLKQFKILHQGGYSDDEREMYKACVWCNTVESMQVLLRGMALLEQPIAFPEGDEAVAWAQSVLQLQPRNPDFVLGEAAAELIRDLWAHPAVRATFEHATELQLNDSAEYYFDNVVRLGAADYLPSDQDILRSRVMTTDVVETTFVTGGVPYRVVDVGGQRSERRKWVKCFENVTAILFCVALSDYDMTLREDGSENRMHDVLRLFEAICNSRWFANADIILLLNKCDIFRTKIQKVPLSVCFPDYSGGADYKAATKFVTKKFLALNKSAKRTTIYPHITCATDTKNVRFVWAAINDIVARTALKSAGLM